MSLSRSAGRLPLSQQVRNPSLGAVLNQAYALVQELRQITDADYPREACCVREVFQAFAEYILEILWKSFDPSNPLIPSGDPGFARTRALARALQKLYSYVEFLHTSKPSSVPPGLQVALARLTKSHFALAPGASICLVRPQWDYNLSFVPLASLLKDLVLPGVLDPTGGLSLTRDNLLSTLWSLRAKRHSEAANPPQHLAILSFAGLDAHDVLLYPLLAHELGHFIDFSNEPPRHQLPEVLARGRSRTDDIRQILTQTYHRAADDREVVKLEEQLNNLIQISLREILADLIAVRMLGVSYFIALAEFLKTIVGWQYSTVFQRQGYPAHALRLEIILRHLLGSALPLNPLTFIEQERDLPADLGSWLKRFLTEWQVHLASLVTPASSYSVGSTLERALTPLADSAVTATLPLLEEIAVAAIPNDKCAALTKTVSDRLERLRQRLPPFLPEDTSNSASFAEILAAGWIYEFQFGERREVEHKDVGSQYEEYSKTCRLVLKAVELSAGEPLSRGRPDAPRSSAKRRPAGRPGILSATDIITRAHLPARHKQYLGIVPVDIEAAKGASLDVRLGNWFSVARRPLVANVSLSETEAEEDSADSGMEELFVPFEGKFLIHPGDLVLGASLEFVALPPDLTAFVEGRSSLGRRGLIVATASPIAPGFHGVVVLELVNAGTVPLVLKPGIAIAQLVFQTMSSPASGEHLYSGRFDCQIKPLHRAPLKLWAELRR
jgi:dCTP deaminase